MLPQPFKKPISLTILIIVPMMFTNTMLANLHRVDFQQQVYVLIAIGALLAGISLRFMVKPIIEKIRKQNYLKA